MSCLGLIQACPKTGATVAEMTQESSSAVEMTGKSEEANSAALDLAKNIGIKPVQVISVPVSSGMAQVSKA